MRTPAVPVAVSAFDPGRCYGGMDATPPPPPPPPLVAPTIGEKRRREWVPPPPLPAGSCVPTDDPLVSTETVLEAASRSRQFEGAPPTPPPDFGMPPVLFTDHSRASVASSSQPSSLDGWDPLLPVATHPSPSVSMSTFRFPSCPQHPIGTCNSSSDSTSSRSDRSRYQSRLLLMDGEIDRGTRQGVRTSLNTDTFETSPTPCSSSTLQPQCSPPKLLLDWGPGGPPDAADRLSRYLRAEDEMSVTEEDLFGSSLDDPMDRLSTDHAPYDPVVSKITTLQQSPGHEANQESDQEGEDGIPRVPLQDRRSFPGLLSEFGGIRRYMEVSRRVKTSTW